ncbi:MAG: C2 family cysteine protease [Chloroflexales bacterium]
MSVVPTGSVVGADTDQLRNLARQLQQMASTLADRTTDLRKSMEALGSSWSGQSRNRGVALWEQTMPRCYGSVEILLRRSQQLIELAAKLDEAGARFGDQADTMCVDLPDPKTTGNYSYERQDGVLFVDGISPDDIQQRGLGDCYFLAALASIARQSPDTLRKNITYDGNQTYTVTLYDPSGKPVQVKVDSDIPVDANGNPVYAQLAGGGSELWVALYEKAYAQYRTDYTEVDKGGLPGSAAQTITGRPADILDRNTVTIDQLYQHFVDGDALTVGIFENDLNKQGTLPPGIHGNHAYSIVGVDPVKGTVQLRNPWGFDHPQEMSIDEFRKYCGYVAANP